VTSQEQQARTRKQIIDELLVEVDRLAVATERKQA
jgi:hypothetical protein